MTPPKVVEVTVLKEGGISVPEFMEFSDALLSFGPGRVRVTMESVNQASKVGEG